MKTKEFIEKVESMGYKIKIIDNLTFVFDGDNITVLSISNDRQYGIDCDYSTPATPELFSAAVEYAKTPISKRSTKYHVKINGLSLSNGDGSYLNFDPINGNYFVYSLNGYFKNKFTDDEIDELVNDPDFFLQTGNYEAEEAE